MILLKLVWWWAVVLLQFVFAALTLYRRLGVYGRRFPLKIPRHVETAGCPIWEPSGKSSEYCFALFLTQAFMVLAVLFVLPQEIAGGYGMAFAIFWGLTNYCSFIYERQRVDETNREIAEAEKVMDDAIRDLQKIDIHA